MTDSTAKRVRAYLDKHAADHEGRYRHARPEDVEWIQRGGR